MTKTLSTSDNKALSDHTGDLVNRDPERVVSILRGGAQFIGCKEEVPDSMMDALKSRVLTKYALFTHQDLTNAFNYYIDHFEGKKAIWDLNGVTLAMILNPYIGYIKGLKAKVIAIKGDKNTDESTEIKVVQDEASEAESFLFIDKYCANHPTLPLGASWTWAYDYAIKKGLIKRDDGDVELRESMTKDRIKLESQSTQDPKAYRRDNLTHTALSRRMKEDLIKEYMKKLHGVTKHKWA